MGTHSGPPDGQVTGGGLPSGDDWEHASPPPGNDQKRAGQQPPDDVAGAADVPGGDEVTGEAQAGSPEAQARSPEAQARLSEAQVDEVIAGLDGLYGRPLTEHVAVFEEAHAKLRQVLSDLDDGPADS